MGSFFVRDIVTELLIDYPQLRFDLDLAPAMPGGAIIRFHGVRATEQDDAIDVFGARRQVAAHGVSISSWDPAQLMAPGAEQQSHLDAGELPLPAIDDGSGIFA